jgi:hypothetical protein
MGEGIGGDAASGLPLDPVVSDRPGGPESLLHIPRLQKPLSCRAVPPYPGQAVGLQLHGHRVLVPHARPGLLELSHPAFDTQEALEVVADFVSQNVRLREVPGAPNRVLRSS